MGHTQAWSETRCNRVSRPFTATILHLRGIYLFPDKEESKSIDDIEKLWYRNKSDSDDSDQDYEPQCSKINDVGYSEHCSYSVLSLSPENTQEFKSSLKKICLFFDTVYHQEPSRLQHLTSIKLGKNMLMKQIQNDLKYKNSKKRNFDVLDYSSSSDTESECESDSDNLGIHRLQSVNNSISALYNRWILFGFGLEFMADNINYLVPILFHLFDYFIEREMWYAARWFFKATLTNIDSFIFWKLFNKFRVLSTAIHFDNKSILYNSCVNKLNNLNDLYYFIENRCWTLIENKSVYMEVIFQTINVVLRDLTRKGFSQVLLFSMLDDYIKIYGTVDQSVFLNGVYVILIIHKYQKCADSDQYNALKAVSKLLKMKLAGDDTCFEKIYINNKIVFRWLSLNIQLFNDITPSLDFQSILCMQRYLALRPEEYQDTLTEIKLILNNRMPKESRSVKRQVKLPLKHNFNQTPFKDNICLLRNSKI